MNASNSEISNQALQALKGNWGLAIATYVVYIIIIGAVGAVPIFGQIITLIIAGPFSIGAAIFAISLSRDKNPNIEQIFSGFNRLPQAIVAYILMVVFIILWSLLLIIPGIIAGISYAMTFYIMAEDESIGGMQAIDKSKEMMNGYKMKYFLLCLRFLGLGILCVFTIGIGFFWLIPYMQICIAKFYDDIKGEQTESYFKS